MSTTPSIRRFLVTGPDRQRQRRTPIACASAPATKRWWYPADNTFPRQHPGGCQRPAAHHPQQRPGHWSQCRGGSRPRGAAWSSTDPRRDLNITDKILRLRASGTPSYGFKNMEFGSRPQPRGRQQPGPTLSGTRDGFGAVDLRGTDDADRQFWIGSDSGSLNIVGQIGGTRKRWRPVARATPWSSPAAAPSVTAARPPT